MTAISPTSTTALGTSGLTSGTTTTDPDALIGQLDTDVQTLERMEAQLGTFATSGFGNNTQALSGLNLSGLSGVGSTSSTSSNMFSNSSLGGIQGSTLNFTDPATSVNQSFDASLQTNDAEQETQQAGLGRKHHGGGGGGKQEIEDLALMNDGVDVSAGSSAGTPSTGLAGIVQSASSPEQARADLSQALGLTTTDSAGNQVAASWPQIHQAVDSQLQQAVASTGVDTTNWAGLRPEAKQALVQQALGTVDPTQVASVSNDSSVLNNAIAGLSPDSTVNASSSLGNLADSTYLSNLLSMGGLES